MSDKQKRKTYSSDLRTRQKEFTRDLIMETVSSFVAEGRIHNFSVQDVADRAGISYGSLYRHFKTKEEMLASLYEWGMEKGFEPQIPDNLDDLPAAARQNMANSEQTAEVSIGLIRAFTALNVTPKSVEKHDEQFRKLVSDNLPSLDPEFAKQAVAIIRYLCSSLYWMTFKTRFGFNQEESGAALTWALETLIADLKKRNEQK